MEDFLNFLGGCLFIYIIYRIFFKTSYKKKLTNIHGVGKLTAEDVMNVYPKAEDLKKASATEISNNINGIGMETANKIKSSC